MSTGEPDDHMGEPVRRDAEQTENLSELMASRIGEISPRRPPRVILLITVLWGALLACYAMVAPLGTPPDESRHVDLVFHLATGGDYPEFDERHLARSIEALAFGRRPGTFGTWATPDNAPGTASGEPPRAPVDMSTPARSENHLTQHPPLYYETSALALRVQRQMVGIRSLDAEWHTIRFFAAGLMLPLPHLAWTATRRLGGSDAVGTVAAMGIVAVPQLAHIGTAVNNDSLLTLLGALMAVALAGVLRGDLRRSVAAYIGLLAGLALLTKAFALVLVVWFVAVYGLRAWRHRVERRSALVSGALAGVVCAAVSAWWWIDNLVRHGRLMPRLADEIYSSSRRPAGFEPDQIWHLQRFALWLPRRFWGSFGHHVHDIGPVFTVGATAALIGALLVAFVRSDRFRNHPGGPPVGRATLVVFGLPIVMLLVIVYRRARQVYLAMGATQFIHGRYLFAAIIPLVVLSAIGLHRLLRDRAAWVVLGAASVMHVEAARVMLDAWWGEPGASVGRSVRSLLAWNPLPVPVVPVALLVALVMVAAIAYETRRSPGSVSGGGPVGSGR